MHLKSTGKVSIITWLVHIKLPILFKFTSKNSSGAFCQLKVFSAPMFMKKVLGLFSGYLFISSNPKLAIDQRTLEHATSPDKRHYFQSLLLLNLRPLHTGTFFVCF